MANLGARGVSRAGTPRRTSVTHSEMGGMVGCGECGSVSSLRGRREWPISKIPAWMSRELWRVNKTAAPLRGVRQEGEPFNGASLAAFVVYFSISIIFFGVPLLADLKRFHIANGMDPSAMIWFLAWWPYALSHRLNPFHPNLVWAPEGVNLAWATAIPGASLLAFPMTFTLGPVATYDILCLLAPALAAWTAYILCRYITKNFWGSLVGGYLFGFSTYELAHLPGHLSLTLIFILPLLIYLVLRRLNGDLKPPTFVLLLTLALVSQFLFSNEIFAIMMLFGFITLLLAFLLFPVDVKTRLVSTARLIGVAYVLAAVVLSPYLYYVFVSGFPRTPINNPKTFSSDLLNFLIPTPITFLGHRQFVDVTSQFTAGVSEATAYLGLPLILIIVSFARAHSWTPLGKLLMGSLCLVCLASLGPRLHVAGMASLSLPWRLMVHLPLVNHALPARFMMFAFLIAAILVAIWSSSDKSNRWAKRILIPLSILFLLPNVVESYLKPVSHWKGALETPVFFADGLYREHLCPGENTLPIPYGQKGLSMLWQAQSGFYFRMAGGYVNTATPPEFLRWPIVRTFSSEKLLIPDYDNQLKAFLRAHDVRTVIVEEGSRGPWKQLFSTLGVEPIKVGGVILYQLRKSTCT